ncbi:hypothetical protein [Shewanella fidelis]|uniref:Uncharacterized protein n=1 Tax=Shewanella fidelis TaxID=173509 RepID=A0AAW8NL82_9GAMM|nr:hypothetical protein [Shewanella fidelis]MDR8522663.1 hypothetical protein [Shewanella fidelis]MDW4812278.1 hypothetical protein [Shewanella fidelis]MDW4816057.1 hypothetical protein [Shewanella fidelis]MDW4820519.1 hypothetical protein [Shewanella fidelis]MDW4824742.1 hypothetical protein [Shewanella fidelis]
MNISNKNTYLNKKLFTLILVSVLLSSIIGKAALAAIKYAPPTEAIPVLKITTHRTPLTDENKIYANGLMQSPLAVEYKLGPDFINPQFLIKERYTHNLLPFDGWDVEHEFNRLPHFISNVGGKVRKGKNPPKRTNPVRVFYVTNNTGHPDKIDVCVELTVINKTTLSEITRDTCDSRDKKDNAVTIQTLIPVKYQAADFSLTQKNSEATDKLGKKLYVRYYELTSNNSNKFTLANPKRLNIRKPNSNGDVYSIPSVATMRVSKNDRLFYIEALKNEVKNYTPPYNVKNITNFNLNTKNSANVKPIVKFAVMYGKEFPNNVWPSSKKRQLANSMTIRVIDTYGNPADLNLTISNWYLYFGNKLIW